ncbi:MAG TPA: hypothetical protein VK474_09980, partial [Chthoniobacterales bacterium]|nr:hypothetical protein [Chthoniobacterales bacterium]
MRVVILADAPVALIELCGISLLERLLRTLQRVGVGEVIVTSKTPDAIEAAVRRDSPPRSEIVVTVVSAVVP